MTPAGWTRLRAEHQALWQRRGQTVEALSAAAAEGDRSENAEYIYRKKELREIDRRLRFLNRHLERAVVVREAPADPSRVRFGARVELEDEAGRRQQLRIVGAYEAEPARGDISVEAPLARALIGRALDDEVTVEIGGQASRCWVVTGIQYSSSDPDGAEAGASADGGPQPR